MIVIDCGLFPKTRYGSGMLGASEFRAYIVAMPAPSSSASAPIAPELAFSLAFHAILKRARLYRLLRLGLSLDWNFHLVFVVILLFAFCVAGGRTASIFSEGSKDCSPRPRLRLRLRRAGRLSVAFACLFLFVGAG